MLSNNEFHVLVIGEVFTDVYLDVEIENKAIVRLGGVFHSARSLKAINANYSLAFISPSYILDSVNTYANKLGAIKCKCVGTIENAPNVMLIKESTEACAQGYSDLLRDQSKSKLDLSLLRELIGEINPTDIIVYPGKYNFEEIAGILNSKKYRIHLDIQYAKSLSEIKIGFKAQTFIMSSSNEIFKHFVNNDYDDLIFELQELTESILLKENRGGARFFNFTDKNWTISPAFLTSTVHSVGVGDCFNSVFITLLFEKLTIYTALKLSSYVASQYASTFSFEIFLNNVYDIRNMDSIKEYRASFLPWTERTKTEIYIAGPDFPYLDTSVFEKLEECLEYHNFSPHRPIQENGLASEAKSSTERLGMFMKDVELLEKSEVVIAVIINDDPGTYTEIGWAAKANKPIILFDPFHRATNLFLTNSVKYICFTLNEVIDTLFIVVSKEDN